MQLYFTIFHKLSFIQPICSLIKIDVSKCTGIEETINYHFLGLIGQCTLLFKHYFAFKMYNEV